MPFHPVSSHRAALCRGAEISVAEAIALIHQAGGIAAVAHPWTVDGSALHAMMREVGGMPGLAGMEVYQAAAVRMGE